jgi:hypothetical protein
MWRISYSNCLDSVVVHKDNVNATVAAFNGLVFTGSADGTVNVWKREVQGKGTKNSLVQTLLKQEHAVNALAVSTVAPVFYYGSSDGLINCWEGERQLVHASVLCGRKKAVFCLAAAGALLFSSSLLPPHQRPSVHGVPILHRRRHAKVWRCRLIGDRILYLCKHRSLWLHLSPQPPLPRLTHPLQC